MEDSCSMASQHVWVRDTFFCCVFKSLVLRLSVFSLSWWFLSAVVDFLGSKASELLRRSNFLTMGPYEPNLPCGGLLSQRQESIVFDLFQSTERLQGLHTEFQLVTDFVNALVSRVWKSWPQLKYLTRVSLDNLAVFPRLVLSCSWHSCIPRLKTANLPRTSRFEVQVTLQIREFRSTWHRRFVDQFSRRTNSKMLAKRHTFCRIGQFVARVASLELSTTYFPQRFATGRCVFASLSDIIQLVF